MTPYTYPSRLEWIALRRSYEVGSEQHDLK